MNLRIIFLKGDKISESREVFYMDVLSWTLKCGLGTAFYFLTNTPSFKRALVLLAFFSCPRTQSTGQVYLATATSSKCQYLAETALQNATSLLTNNVQAAVELADTIASSSLTHLFHFYPLIQMGIVFLHTGKRCYTVIATHSVNMVLLYRERLFVMYMYLLSFS